MTKEKVVALVAVLLALFVLYDAVTSRPAVEDVPVIPEPEKERSWRAYGGAPVLSPDKIHQEGDRNPFEVQDEWQRSQPAPLGIPPREPWGRQLPGGVVVDQLPPQSK